MWTPNCARICSSRSVNAPILSLSRLSAPSTRFLWRSGTTSCEFTPGTSPRYRGSWWTSLTRIGLLLGDRRADDALADLQAEVQHHVERIAFGVRDPQLLPSLVEHVDREHRERRQPRDEPRNASQQLVDVEHGRHFAAELEQRGDEFLILGVQRFRTCGRYEVDLYNISPDGTADAAARLRGDRKDPSASLSVSARRSHHRARDGQADRRHQEHLVERAVSVRSPSDRLCCRRRF